MALLEASRVKGHWRNKNMLPAVDSVIGRGWCDSAIRMACAAYCDGGAEDADLKKLIDDQRKDFNKPSVEIPVEGSPTNEAIPDSDLPVIEIKDGQLSALATKAEKLLIDAGVPLYQRGGTARRPIIHTGDASPGREADVAKAL